MESSLLTERSDGARIFARAHQADDAGAGATPLLLVHGAAVDSDFFESAAYWLARTHRVASYDRRGYGRSTCPAGASRELCVQAEDAAAVVRDALGGGPAVVVAHSAGCSVALELLARHPELVRDLVLHEPAVMDCLPEGDEALRTIGRAMADVDSGLYENVACRLFSLEQLEDERALPQTPGELEHMDANVLNFASREARVLCQARFDYAGLASRLEESGVRAFVGLGERSLDTYHARGCPELARRLGARLVYFPGGHNCPRDLPLEFSALVEGLLSLT